MSSDEVSLARLIGEQNRLDQLGGGTPERVIDELLQHLATMDKLEPAAIDSMRRAIMAREREAIAAIREVAGPTEGKEEGS